MPQADDLAGLGVSPLVADALGNTANTLTCAGTTQATAATIKTTNTELSAASNQTGAVLPTTAKIGTPYYFACSSSTSAVVYVPVGHSLAGNINDSATVAQNASLILWQYKSKNWAKQIT